VEYVITGSEQNGDTALVRLTITAVFIPDLTSKYITALFDRQFSGDIPTEKNEESQALSNQLFDEMITAPEVDKRTEAIAVEVRRVQGRWKIQPNGDFVSALNGFQDRSPTEEIDIELGEGE
jgi:hypothetical protein